MLALAATGRSLRLLLELKCPATAARTAVTGEEARAIAADAYLHFYKLISKYHSRTIKQHRARQGNHQGTAEYVASARSEHSRHFAHRLATTSELINPSLHWAAGPLGDGGWGRALTGENRPEFMTAGKANRRFNCGITRVFQNSLSVRN